MIVFSTVQEPFALYPGELLSLVPEFGVKSPDYSKALQRMPIVPADCALRLRALVDHTNSRGKRVIAGHMWQVEGPMTYVPQPEVVSGGCRFLARCRHVICIQEYSLRVRATLKSHLFQKYFSNSQLSLCPHRYVCVWVGGFACVRAHFYVKHLCAPT